MQFIQIENLLNPINTLNNNALNINIDNMDYLLNNQSVKKDITVFEKIYASIKAKYPELNNIKLKDIYMANLQKHTIILIPKENNFTLIEIHFNGDKMTSNKVKLSESYRLFNPHNFTNIPVLYKKRAKSNNIKENQALSDELIVTEKK